MIISTLDERTISACDHTLLWSPSGQPGGRLLSLDRVFFPLITRISFASEALAGAAISSSPDEGCISHREGFLAKDKIVCLQSGTSR